MAKNWNAKAYAAASPTSSMAPTTIPRREPNEHDVQIDILFCGICHSDLHTVRDEWKSVFPSKPIRLEHGATTARVELADGEEQIM